MSFPQTRHTLIQRIAGGGDEQDWQQFLSDYWEPICRFAGRRGALTQEDAEDVASQTFEALLRNQLLVRWVSNRSAKLRTLLCTVVRNILANQARVQQGRQRLLREHGGRLDDRSALPLVTSLDAPAEQVEAFYGVWVEEVLRQAVEALLLEYQQAGKGDYFRVLYGKVCEGGSMAEIARALGLTTSTAENYYKHARQRLSQKLEDLVRQHVLRYCPPEEAEAESSTEWSQLGSYLKEHGGLEQAIRRYYADHDPVQSRKARSRSLNLARMRLTDIFTRHAAPP